MHPWENVPLSDYEGHMGLWEVRQLETLNALTKAQLQTNPAKTVSILGIAGGNGLDHIINTGIATVYGIDVNEDYLAECRRRYAQLGDRLVLRQMDLSDESILLPKANLIIANLLIEYIGISRFVQLMEQSSPERVSCIVQQNGTRASFVSASPYKDSFGEISRLHIDVDTGILVQKMEAAGFQTTYMGKTPLPDDKEFIRLDFAAANPSLLLH